MLEIVPGCDEESAAKRCDNLPSQQIAKIEADSIDSSQAFETALRSHAPQTPIANDKRHLSKCRNEAVDKVRGQEHKSLK